MTCSSIDELAAKFGSSRTPVREARITLRHDGWVEIGPNRGVRITGPTRDGLLDRYNVFGVLARTAARWAARAATAEFVAILTQLDEEIRTTTTSEGSF